MPYTYDPDEEEDVLATKVLLHYAFVRFSWIVVQDPSMAYNLDVTNTTSEPGLYSLSAETPIRPLMANTTWGELTIELIDANNDGSASLTGNFGGTPGAIQAVRLRNATTFQAEPVGPTLGSLITAPGMYSFPLAPFSGPTPADKDELVLSLSFLLSPGDTARVASQFIIDEGTGIPFAEIPELPDPADGPYFNVINVDSAETSLREDFTIGPQTQLNLFNGGEIAPGLEAGHSNGDEFGFDFDIQVNVSGGVIRREAGFNRGFRSYAGSEVNLSGGVIEYLVAEHDSVVNVSGGRLGIDNENFDSFEALYVTDDAVANVSGGNVDWIDASKNSVVNITGGAVGNPSDKGVVLHDNSLLNLSGGTVGLVTINNSTGSPSANITGGEVTRISASGATSEVRVQGGTVETLSVGSGSLRSMVTGGAVTGNVSASAGAQIGVAGGTIAALRVLSGATANLFGAEFSLGGTPIAGLQYGVPTVVTARDVVLGGRLSDGTAFSFMLNSMNTPPADFNVVQPDATLTVTLSLPGDYNNDGEVDVADYAVWRSHLGSQTVLPHDVSPGSVTQADYAVWRTNYGRVFAASGSATGVPEPASGVLLVMGAALMLKPCGVRRSNISTPERQVLRQ